MNIYKTLNHAGTVTPRLRKGVGSEVTTPNQFGKLICFLGAILFHTTAIGQNITNEKILYNGKIFTANPQQPYAEAVAIAGDKIVAVGTFASVKAKVDAKAELIDLKGGNLLPGLIDSHNHAISGGESLMAASLNDVFLTKETLGAFAQEILKTRKGMREDVLYIQGMHSAAWAAVNDLNDLFNSDPYLTQPVVLRGSDGHTAWVNQVMLKRAGVNTDFIKSLADDKRKFFGFSENFKPNGLISEEGLEKIRNVLPANHTDLQEAATLGIKHLNSLGITAWLDPSAGDISEGESNGELAIYKTMSQQNKVTAHVVAVVVANADGDADAQIGVLRKLQDQFKGVKNISVVGFKIFADGVLEYPTQTAAVSLPYKNSGEYGSLMFEPEKFKKFVTSADQQKLLVHVHALGDRAVTETLNGFSAARKANRNSTLPHSITHLQLVNPVDFPRFAALNIPVSLQLLWATADLYTIDLVKPYIDPSLFAHQYPALSFLKNGTTIGGASDWPVSSANPFEAIYMAETRLGKKGVLDANESMPRVEMLKAYTIQAAKILMMEKSIGSIEPGKQADFVLVDRDVLAVSADQVKNTNVIWTMFGGEIVFRK